MCCVEVVTSKKIKFEETRFGRPQTRARHNVYITKLSYIAKNSEVRPFEKKLYHQKAYENRHLGHFYGYFGLSVLKWRKGLDTSLKIPFRTLITQQKLKDISVFSIN